MDNETKKLYDRLVQAEWVDNVRDTEAPEQKGVHVHELTLRRLDEDPNKYGPHKIVIFSKLYRELVSSGQMTTPELEMIVTMGKMFAVQHGLEEL